MFDKRSSAKLGVLVAVGAVALAACGGSASTKKAGGSTPSGSAPAAASAAGGTLYYLTKRPVEHWDPQRDYAGRDLANSFRMFNRTLVQFPATDDVAASLKLQPDLATDLGKSSDGAKTWALTLKTGVKWQDGSDVTCADVKYGVSRTFATDIITGGPNYVLQFLDVPVDTKGASQYKGPYTKVGQALYDKAVTCSGQTITFHFKKPWADFSYALTLPAFAPYKQTQDKGDKSNFAVFSDGPYMLQGTWEKGKGGTFVRNPQYDAKTDGVRKALPDKIVMVEGLTDEVIAQRLIADQGPDKNAVTDRRIPPAYQAQVFNSATVKTRTVNPVSPYVDYLLPNFKTLTNPKVRQALAIAFSQSAWITAQGGAATGVAATSINSPALLGYKSANVYGMTSAGDPAKAKTLLESAGVKMPYPITFTYDGGTPTTEKEAAAAQSAWNAAGFKVTLNELTDTYYDVIQNPANASKYDVTWAGWGADWPSASTVIPPLFDDRINLSSASNGQDYGYYASKTVDTAIDAALNQTDVTQQANAWAGIDQTLATDVAYIPIDIEKFVITYGSNITGYINDPNTSMYPDLGVIGIKQ